MLTSTERKSFRAWSMEISAVLPSVTLYLTPRTDAKELSGTTWRVTMASKKCRSAASAWFLVGADPLQLADIFASQGPA